MLYVESHLSDAQSFFSFEPTAYDCRCCENDSPLPKWPARWVFVLLGDFCCDWSLKIKSGTPVINIEAYTAIYMRACILQPYLVSFQATISRQFFSPYSRSDVGRWLMCCVCLLRQWGDRGRQCRGEGERSIPAHYWQSADAFRTVAQTGAACMNAQWCMSQRTQRKTSHICYKITVPAEAPTGL